MANSSNNPVTTVKTKETVKKTETIQVEQLKVNSCTATATITINGVSTTFTNTVTCDCSNATACSQANAGNSANVVAYVQALL